MKKINFIVFTFLLSVFISSCTKDTSTPATTDETKTLLTAHSWQLNSYTSESKDKATVDTLYKWNQELPIAVNFVADGTYSYGTNIEYGTWYLSSDNETIIFNKDKLNESTATIEKLNSLEFSMAYKWKINSNVTSKIIESFRK